MRRVAFGLAVLALTSGWGLAPVAADEPRIAVQVVNASQPVLCAEEDNVTLTFASNTVRRFRIEASHPAYLSALRDDNWKADWTACNFGPKHDAKPKDAGGSGKPERKTQRVTIYEEPDQWLVGWKFPTFWRPETATVSVGGKVVRGLHMIQLWRLRPNGGEEVVVFYPQDGYWRARPLAPRGRDLTAFGSSFLIGPVENDGRPLVRISDVAYEPKAQRFRLTFVKGGHATVTIAELDARRIAFDISFGAAIADGPFAALRSMYVTEFNNDVARVAALRPGGKGWQQAGILGFAGGAVTELWAGRTVPSRHNTSAPDFAFKNFRGASK